MTGRSRLVFRDALADARRPGAILGPSESARRPVAVSGKTRAARAAAVPRVRTGSRPRPPRTGPDPPAHGRRDECRDRARRVSGRGADGRRDQAFRNAWRGTNGTARVMPRRVSRRRSNSRPLANRPRTEPFGAPQIIRGLVAGHPLEIAEDHRQTEPIGEPLDLLVQDRAESSGVRVSAARSRPAAFSTSRRRAAADRASSAVR